MKKQLGAFALCGALLMSTSAAFAQSNEQQPPRHASKTSQQHRGMYAQGRQQGWYKKGGRLPAAYRGRSYMVTDWRVRHLRQPPRGYQWVRSDNGDFLLVAITTGVIISIVAHPR
ncbi:MAG: RcnB family protein [Gammaproteobacteria bacterium]